ncbi:hypothetical protein BGZ68_002429 [Mortierella alpina]|nr:hypothetical protein BGZ68_002429 [Mortierella alpina]
MDADAFEEIEEPDPFRRGCARAFTAMSSVAARLRLQVTASTFMTDIAIIGGMMDTGDSLSEGRENSDRSLLRIGDERAEVDGLAIAWAGSLLQLIREECDELDEPELWTRGRGWMALTSSADTM